jgi:hypothetical protein
MQKFLGRDEKEKRNREWYTCSISCIDFVTTVKLHAIKYWSHDFNCFGDHRGNIQNYHDGKATG